MVNGPGGNCRTFTDMMMLLPDAEAVGVAAEAVGLLVGAAVGALGLLVGTAVVDVAEATGDDAADAACPTLVPEEHPVASKTTTAAGMRRRMKYPPKVMTCHFRRPSTVAGPCCRTVTIKISPRTGGGER
jgi:hypothetical protein